MEYLRSVDPGQDIEVEFLTLVLGVGRVSPGIREKIDGKTLAGRWEVIAVAQGPTDFVGVEAECVVSGVDTEYLSPYWRSQPCHGLAMRHCSKAAFVSFAQSLPDQYKLTKAALAALPSPLGTPYPDQADTGF